LKKIPNRAFDEFVAADAALAEAREARAAARARLVEAIGRANGGTCAHGDVTYMAHVKHVLDTARLKAKKPALYQRYCTRQVVRQLQVYPK
jgi:hypothetical protein